MNTVLSGKDWSEIEGEFNHHHIMAEGAAGLLFKATIDDKGSTNNSIINSSAYALQSCLLEMNKNFDMLLKAFNECSLETENKVDARIEEMRGVEAARQSDIMEIVYEFSEEYPQLKTNGIDAIADGTTSEQFKEHALKIISYETAKSKGLVK